MHIICRLHVLLISMQDDNGEIIVNSSVIKSRRKDDVKCMYQKPLAFSDLLCLSNKYITCLRIISCI